MISVAMATYNGEKHLKEQIDSILNQTIQVDEIVITDDNSSDKTVEILSQYAEINTRIKFFVNAERLGFKKNFEKAISLCTGDFIALSDQDDIWLPNHIEWLSNNLGTKSLAVGNAELINEDGSKKNILLSETEQFQYFSENSMDVLEHILFCVNPFQGASMLFSKAFSENLLPIPETVAFHDTWFAVNALCQNGIAYTFDPITLYRQAESTVTKHIKRSRIQHIKDRFVSLFSKKSYNTTRPALCNELQKKYPAEDFPILDNIVKKALCYHHTLKSRKNKTKTTLILIKDYKKIFAVTNYKHCLSRVLRIWGL
ncbi:MAG: glycosyltransferase [Treponema sp.]|uniref:glycosyltransferase n=1 Tax=Treponema sp. TaxID=166 RepID=UPI002A91541E|nr:glycosyltransferase [Treponema sp.]MDY6398838.1 glycosyltransferase [Treponema sp.]